MLSLTGLNPGRNFLMVLLLIMAIVVVDQYSKWFVMEVLLRMKNEMPLFKDWFFTARPLAFFEGEREQYKTLTLTGFLNLVMVWNQGVSFGLFNSNSEHMPLVFVGVALLISMLMLIWAVLSPSRYMRIVLGLIIGGAMGNVLDRIRFGAVVDFIDLHAGGWHWPAFNVADSCIVLGAIFLALDVMFNKEKKNA